MSSSPCRRAAGLLIALALNVHAQQPPAGSVDAQRRLPPGTEAEHSKRSAERDALVATAERSLADGEPAAARAALEQAALLAHAADTELTLVRALMQGGAYRQALAFCAHAAGAHPEVPEGTALHAWLLDAGGQGRYAERVLDDAIARRPGAAVLATARRELATGWPSPSGWLDRGFARAAPYASGAPVDADARAAGSAIALDGGAAALVSTALLGSATRIWVRNGLGRTAAAAVAERRDDIGLALLRLQRPLDAPLPLTRSAREPFAGSPGTLVEYASGTADAAWPLLRQGFFGRPARDGGAPRPLGFETPPGARGGPVFDAAGSLAGIALRDAAGADRLLPVGAWPEAWIAAAPASDERRPAMAADEVYERSLRVALQLIVAD